MAAANARVLHVLCTAFLVVAFLSVGVGAWAIANDSGEGGVNIGAGILLYFGYLLGAIGLALGVAALVTGAVSRRRSLA